MALREEALYASYRRLERPLFNVLYRQLWQSEDCQDLIQDAYMRVWERRAKVDEQTLDALIWTTALNLAKNRLRWRLLRRHEPLDEDSMQDHATTIDTTDFLAQRQLRRALRSLPAASREVLLLAEFSGLNGAEIATILGISAGTVASRKHLAMAKLKALLGDRPDA